MTLSQVAFTAIVAIALVLLLLFPDGWRPGVSGERSVGLHVVAKVVPIVIKRCNVKRNTRHDDQQRGTAVTAATD